MFASTSGTDSDFIVKLIDVYPEDAVQGRVEAGRGTGSWRVCEVTQRLPVADRDGSAARPVPQELFKARTAGGESADQFTIPLRDHDHVFLKGHRLMVQVQSTWFPVIDRNPQSFGSSIYVAKASDFVPATQRVYSTPKLPSHIVLPVMP